MQIVQRIWRYLQQHRMVTMMIGHVCVLLVLATLFLGSGLGAHILGAFAQTPCASGDQTYLVKGGDTLGAIAAHYGISSQSLATYNHIANPNLIYVNEAVCVPGNNSTSHVPLRGAGNPFPYGQCTWYASQRYYQLHGVYVPWTTQSNAWQWTARAQDFFWHVSTKPSFGAIVDLQPWVEGAYGLGHVAVVERILPNGNVIASSMNWGAYPEQVTDIEFAPGNGVTFLTLQ
jgi:N-acetylmuramoyl-L-alanine amidase